MKITVTGASGFIGSELLEYMSELSGIEIVALTRGESAKVDSPYCNSRNCEWRSTDYSVGSLSDVLADSDVAIHLAGARGTTNDPADYAVNEEITENLLKAMEKAGTKRIVFASTISVYDDVSLIPWKEDDPLKGRTMYGESKINCEQLILSYAEERGFSYAIIRIAQVLGMGEKRRGMMNVFLDAARAGDELRVIGRSEAKRQYIYVRDLVKIICGYAMSTDNMIVNAGMPNAYTNLEIAEMVNKVFDNRTPISYDSSVPETIRPSCMDIGLLLDTSVTAPVDMEEALSLIKMKNESPR